MPAVHDQAIRDDERILRGPDLEAPLSERYNVSNALDGAREAELEGESRVLTR